MSNKDELRKRFPGEDDTDNSNDSDSLDNSDNASNTQNTSNTRDVSTAENASDTRQTPGPDKDPNSTRNRKQVPMYLTEEKADLLNALYERLDGRSKVEGQGGIEKHADFMEEVVEIAVDYEDELADRLGIE